MTMADKIVVLRGGRVEQIGRPLDLYNNPANRFVAGFMGAPQMNFVKGEVTQSGVRIIDGLEKAVPLIDDHGAIAVEVGIRPENIGVSLDGDGDVRAKVNSFEQLGAITYIYSELSTGEALTVQLAAQIPLQRGQEIGVTIPQEALHVFGGDNGVSLTRIAK